MQKKIAMSELEAKFSTPVWLYQMRGGGAGVYYALDDENELWYPSSYRREVNEGRPVTWDIGRIYFLGMDRVSIGDKVILFFCKSSKKDPVTSLPYTKQKFDSFNRKPWEGLINSGKDKDRNQPEKADQALTTD